MILVTGATGTVGRAVMDALAGRAEVVAAVREPGDVANARRFDFADPASYSAALAGAQALFLLLPPGLPHAVDRFAAVLSHARQAGVRRAAFLSIRNADRLTVLPHRKLEQVVEASGLEWTHLRPNDFMQNFATQPVYRDGIRKGELWAANGRSVTSYVDVRDIGAAAAKVLTEGGYAGHAYSLTGPEELSLDQVGEQLGEELRRPVVNRRPGFARFVLHARRSGAPLPLALVMASIGLVARLGYARGIDPDLEQLLERRPTDFRTFVRDYRTVWGA